MNMHRRVSGGWHCRFGRAVARSVLGFGWVSARRPCSATARLRPMDLAGHRSPVAHGLTSLSASGPRRLGTWRISVGAMVRAEFSLNQLECSKQVVLAQLCSERCDDATDPLSSFSTEVSNKTRARSPRDRWARSMETAGGRRTTAGGVESDDRGGTHESEGTVQERLRRS